MDHRRPAQAPHPRMSDDEHAATTLELVRLCLPHTGEREALFKPLREGVAYDSRPTSTDRQRKALPGPAPRKRKRRPAGRR